MKNQLFILSVLFFFSVVHSAQAQAPKDFAAPPFAIKGKLVNQKTGNAVEFATVSVFNQADSSLVTGGLTDVEGVFNIPIKPGRYYLRIQFMGFKEVMISDVVVNRQTKIFNVGNVSMAENETLLDEVVVQAERTEMELTLDKKVYNIGKDLSNLGGSASDLLANLPSVEVDVEGNVSLRGSQNVQILIDGKPSGLIGLSGSGGLQQLQGNLVERVEIVTNPSARYDAEGGAGIINIILKKDRAKGFNGSFQVQGGLPANNGASVNVNYRTGWINWFVNYGITARTSPGEGFTNNFFNPPDSSYFRNEDNDRERKSLSQNIRFGSDIYFNEKNVLTLSASYRDADSDNTTITIYDFFDGNRTRFADRRRVDNEDEVDTNWQYELNFDRKFDRKGQKLSFTLQQQDSEETEISAFDDVTNFTNGFQDELIQRARNDNGENRQLMQLDYVHPFGAAAKYEVGLRYNGREIFNNYIVESDSAATGLEENFEEVVALTNNFSFDERIFAAYAILSNKYEKLSWQLGLRAEQTNLDTQLIPRNEEESGNEDFQPNSQSYFSLFPSANLSYKYSNISSVQLSYSRRISRPRFRNLNPFITYSNPLSLFLGNPELQPQFTDSYELGLLQNRRSSSFYFGVYYRYTTDAVQRIQRERAGEEGVLERLPVNLGVEKDIGIEANLNYDFSKQFRVTSNFNFFNSRVDGGSRVDGEEDLSAEATTISSRIGAFYRNPKLVNAQLTWFYRGPQNRPQGVNKSIQSLDLGFSRDILKKNGTIALNIQDLFNTRKFRNEATTETFTSDTEFQWRRGPTGVISFTYRLNQSKRRGERSGSRSGDNGDGEYGF
ncbi:MAG: TonB-dependent receptor [Bacteroidota bacterium]